MRDRGVGGGHQSRERGSGEGWAGMHWKGGEDPPPHTPPGRPAYAQPVSS